MADKNVTVYHPELDVYSKVPPTAVPHFEKRGWVLQDEPEPEKPKKGKK